jgi:hypothetical protein
VTDSSGRARRYTMHTCLSVRGALSWDKRQFRNALSWITKPGGERYRSVDHLRDALFDELAKGHEVIPIGEPCEGFDYKTGCPTHEIPEEPEVDGPAPTERP